MKPKRSHERHDKAHGTHPEAREVTAAAKELTKEEREITKEIEELAYLFWEERGCQGGSAEEDWIRAEAEVRKRRNAAAARASSGH